MCVFHSIRFKVNKGWVRALTLFLYPYCEVGIFFIVGKRKSTGSSTVFFNQHLGFLHSPVGFLLSNTAFSLSNRFYIHYFFTLN